MKRCVAIAMVLLFASAAHAEVPASAYVQRGLIAHWDAIENGGRGVHNADVGASGWVDLVRGVTLTANTGVSGLVTTGAKGITLDAASLRAYDDSGAVALLVKIVGAAQNTIELSGVDTGTEENRWVMFQSAMTDGTSNRIFGWINNNAKILDYYYLYSNKGGSMNLPVPLAVGTRFTLSAVRTSLAARTLYKDGAHAADKEVASTSPTSPSKGGISLHSMSYEAAPDVKTTPTYHSLRIYSIGLTAAEIAYNANLDKIRFDGADPTALVWPTGYRWNVERGLPEFAVTVAYGEGIASVTADGVPVANGGQVWVSANDGGQRFSATLTGGSETAQWSAENAIVSSSVRGTFAALSAVVSPTVLRVVGVAKASLSDLPINGLVQHYDATDTSTITQNANGNVLEWRSKIVNAANPVVPALKGWCYTDSLNPDNFPFYSATELEGRGGVYTGRAFSSYPSGSPVCVFSGLTGTVATVNRTVFFVMRPLAKLDKINRGVFFGEAGGNTSLAFYTTSNSMGVNNKDGFAASGWLWQNGYCYSQPGSAGNLTTIVKSPDRTLVVGGECTDATLLRYPSFRPALARAYGTTYGHVHGVYGELVIYDRVLKQGEITYINARLRDKWLDTFVVRRRTRWIGGSGNWRDASKWDNGIPDAARVAVIANATVTVTDADACAWDLELKDATLTLAAGAELRVEEVTAAFGNSTIAVGAGATFATDDWCEPWGAGPSIALAGGKFVYMPRPTAVWRSWFKAQDAVYDDGTSYANMEQLQNNSPESTHRSMLPKVTGTGEFCCAGAGVTELDADHLPDEGLALTVAGGALELNGLDLKVKSLGGTAILRNSGARPATVTVEASDAALLTPHLEGALKVVAKGGGTFRHLGSGQAQCDVVVDGSTLCPTKDVVVRKYGNPVVHLDASMPETMVLNAAGKILRWNSPDGHGKSFSVHPVTTVNSTSYTNTAPVWSATAFNGKPAALFTTTADGSAMATSAEQATPAVIRSVSASTNLTFFIVGRFYGNSHTGFFSFIGGAFAGGKPYLYTQSVGGQSDQVWRFGANFSYALDNGKVIYDYAGGQTEPVPYSAFLNRDIVVAYRAGESLTDVVYASTIACGDQSYLQRAMCGKFCEVLVYDTRLSDAAMKEISAQLMAKWGIEPAEGAEPVPAKGSIGSQSAIVLKGGATLDLGGLTNEVSKIVADASGGTAELKVVNGCIRPETIGVAVMSDGQLPLMTGDARWELDDVTLDFTPPDTARPGTLLYTTDVIVGEIGSITGSRRKYRASSRKIATNPGLLFVVE